MKKTFLFLGYCFLLSISANAQQEKSASFTIGAGSYLAAPINVNEGVFHYKCRFRAQGGSRNDIQVMIMDADNFENWKNGNSADTYYNSGRKTVGSFDVTLGKGTYFSVFNNNYSLITPKAVIPNRVNKRKHFCRR
jgi:hypothetical protein